MKQFIRGILKKWFGLKLVTRSRYQNLQDGYTHLKDGYTRFLGKSMDELDRFEKSVPPQAMEWFLTNIQYANEVLMEAATHYEPGLRLDSLSLDQLTLLSAKKSLTSILFEWLAAKGSDARKTLEESAATGELKQVLEAVLEDCQSLSFERALRNSRIRELYLKEIFLGIEDITLPVGAVNEKTGHANATDLLFVSAMAKHRQAKKIFEFGTYTGRTTYHLSLASENATVTTLNLPPEKDSKRAPFFGLYYKDTDQARRIREIHCDSFEFDARPYRKKMDFIFVDADHSYEGVKSDTAKAFEMLAPGGAIVWHDYAAKSPGVYQFFEEFTRKTPLFRIRKTCLLLYLDGVDPFAFQPHSMFPGDFRKQHRNAA